MTKAFVINQIIVSSIISKILSHRNFVPYGILYDNNNIITI